MFKYIPYFCIMFNTEVNIEQPKEAEEGYIPEAEVVQA